MLNNDPTDLVYKLVDDEVDYDLSADEVGKLVVPYHKKEVKFHILYNK